MSFSKTELEAVKKAVLQRRTFKVLRDPVRPVVFDESTIAALRQKVRDAVAIADSAPFHYDRAVDGVPQPWRVDILWHDACQAVAGSFYEWFTDVKPGNKIPAMLSACGACVVVSWLPQFEQPDDGHDALPKRKQRDIDEEHLAAASAYVQNLLLLLTATNMGTYWSSGGQFRDDSMKAKIGLAKGRVLAAVFVEFPADGESDVVQDAGDVQRLPGKLADKRAEVAQWCKEIAIGDS